ncbi:MAG: 2-oxoacid:ferredoxin oxidoreductase subunit gamma [Nitrososphaeria archaeon]|nr:2-oxoacid:ferredoxin oxidoreductase subunit gamma [Nitrososphaeria archaeon]NIN52614.1 2-oxoacid:ferredoxin oxidoreductase subunit gamma [Nitrososphaeria archaeon]NIQ33089.1 2-oxoacid:ferredoxin oxidoreductase subunit gamma [Nitrososphaeria archaeon]
MKRLEIRIAGFGGQGVILAGVLLARAAALHDQKKVVQTQSYGGEARGGAAKSEVVISNEQIRYPKLIGNDILVAMSQTALNRYSKDLGSGGTLIVEADLVSNIPKRSDISVYRVSATKIATEELKSRVAANMIMLGILVGVTDVVSKEAIAKAVWEGVPKGTEDINLKALKRGFEIAEQLKKER